ncbi:NADH dehydrogenase [ubiquinone] 1 alpha subcomplex subunit 13 [Venturia canescens]|uniref:NADH dehydrogenase [ubiquinone] 1 alpha subcomplex subunit 13 n=1 Tax=Venturia canescens TaxID=32260 RepID=UPI001C9CA82B|nr:NADH dehydrogenase [ubiquinone] 1 alpha subcomplex subunit 13 [Venturia canescens]
MATAAKTGPQDLPPPGGYQTIPTERTRLKSVIGWKTGIAAFVVTNVFGWIVYSIKYRDYKRRQIEMRSARLALIPILWAERDRAFLKQTIKNRDEEADLMKDYPGWEVGTYFGEPIYKTVPEDTFIVPQLNEYAVHAPKYGITYQRAIHRHMT